MAESTGNRGDIDLTTIWRMTKGEANGVYDILVEMLNIAGYFGVCRPTRPTTTFDKGEYGL